jgi:Uma2 family endonuclease
MTVLRRKRMTVDEFLAWAPHQPKRFELFDGVPVAMSPERVIHGRTKYQVARTFNEAIAAADLPCEAVLDSAAVRIDAASSYQPDVMVYCGEPVPGDTVEIPDPVIVVEVLSPGNAMKDLRDKLVGYFRVGSIRHYLIVDPDKRLVIHHSRGESSSVTTRVVSDKEIALDPPGLTVGAASFFGKAPAGRA